MKQKLSMLAAAFPTLALLLSACGSTPATPTPTPIDVAAVQTNAVATFAFGLTQTMIAMPTATPTATATATLTPQPTMTASTPSTVVPTQACYAMSFVKDVTIPDNTAMNPGQKFTKTWRVRNSGTCAWESGFKFAFASGDAMSGATVVLSKAVASGEEIELSVELTTPNKSGSLQGNWRMAQADGTFFGEQVYVLIKVTGTSGTSTITPTPTETTEPTDTLEPTETETP
jgi:hypothetical protein